MTLFLRSSDRRVDSTVVWRRARSWSIRAGFVSTSLDVEEVEVEVVGLSLPRLNGSVLSEGAVILKVQLTGVV